MVLAGIVMTTLSRLDYRHGKDSMTQTPQYDQAAARPKQSPIGTPEVGEGIQPDPTPSTTTRGAGPVGITLLAVVVAFSLAVFFYGLNSGEANRRTAAAPAGPPAAQSGKPAAGGKSGPAVPTAPHAGTSGVKG